jgi:hypothetical protein
MKAIGYIAVALACTAFSTAASSATYASTKKCVDSLVAQELGDRPVDVRFRKPVSSPSPVMLTVEMPVQLTMVDKNTGRTIAVAECDPRRGLVDVTEGDRAAR